MMYVSGDNLFRLLSPDKVVYVLNGLPDGAVFKGANYDYFRGQFAVCVGHESFAEVADGQVIPQIDVRFVQLPAVETVFKTK